MSAGGELERARVALGLSLEEISHRTKVTVEHLSAIERQDLDELPPLIYTTGFLRVYASELSLDSDDLVSRYLSELDERATLREFESEEVPRPGSATEAIRRPWRPAQFLPDPSPGEVEPNAAGVSVPGVVESRDEQLLPMAMTLEPSRPNWRAALATVLGLLLLASIAGAVGYIAGSRSDQPRSAVVSSSASPDAEGRTTPPADDAVRVGNERSTEAVRDSEASTDLNGAWTFTNRVDSTSYGAFKNLTLGYHVRLHHRGDRVWGEGFKTTENGRVIAQPGRTPIALEGTVDRGIVELQFTEQGARRSTGGRFVLNIEEDGSLVGTFSSAAANSSGESRARRTNPD